MPNRAKEVLTPKKPGILRVTFLYVGQGEATLLSIPDGDKYLYVLIDNNNDKKNGGIDVNGLLIDLLDKDNLHAFINTHPHSDHLAGIKDIHDSVGVNEVWHSGHNPGKDHDESYQNMMSVIKKIGKKNEYILFGSNSRNKVRKADKKSEVVKSLGDIDYQILAPAKYVADDIKDEKPDARYNRIHEQCAVIRLTYGKKPKHILLTGDSDKKAWKNHITQYHKDKLKADVLSASHHCSITFFKENDEDDDVYKEHLKKIDPTYLIISAPKKSESKHNHPNDEAKKLYEEKIDKKNIFHLGKNRESIIVDIDNDGKISIKFDKTLRETYQLDKKESKKKEQSSTKISQRTTYIDNKPMG